MSGVRIIGRRAGVDVCATALVGCLGLLALMFGASASMAAEPTRAQVIADMSRGVDMCLDALRTGDTSAIEALPVVTPPRSNPVSALPGGAVGVRLDKQSRDALVFNQCRVATLEWRQDNLLRLTLVDWAKTKTAEITAGHDVTLYYSTSRTRTPASAWCDGDMGLVATIGAIHIGRGVSATIHRTPVSLWLLVGGPTNKYLLDPCNPE